MSILNCYTRLTIINRTGLPAIFRLTPSTSVRLQPIGTAHVTGTIQSSAASISEWLREFIQLITYGPTYNKLVWTIAPGKEETVRFNAAGPMTFEIDWTDPSVSWEQREPGKWSIDISKVTDVTMFLRGDVGEYIQLPVAGRPATIKSVHLKHSVEVACDDEIPFCIERTPVSKMFWRKDINLKALVCSV